MNMIKIFWYRYIKGYTPDYKFVKSGVTIFLCKKCSKPIILHKVLFLPIRYYKADNNLMFQEISDLIRKAWLK